MYYQSIK